MRIERKLLKLAADLAAKQQDAADVSAEALDAMLDDAADEPIPYRITPAGREHLDGKA
jgi:hypothetical protein